MALRVIQIAPRDLLVYRRSSTLVCEAIRLASTFLKLFSFSVIFFFDSFCTKNRNYNRFETISVQYFFETLNEPKLKKSWSYFFFNFRIYILKQGYLSSLLNLDKINKKPERQVDYSWLPPSWETGSVGIPLLQPHLLQPGAGFRPHPRIAKKYYLKMLLRGQKVRKLSSL